MAKSYFCLGLQSAIELGATPQDQRVQLLLELKFSHSEVVYLKTRIAHSFKIQKETWQELCSTEKTLSLQPDLIKQLLALSIGTTRGILFAKLQNTQMEGYVLPTINVNDWVKEPIQFDLSPS